MAQYEPARREHEVGADKSDWRPDRAKRRLFCRFLRAREMCKIGPSDFGYAMTVEDGRAGNSGVDEKNLMAGART